MVTGDTRIAVATIGVMMIDAAATTTEATTIDAVAMMTEVATMIGKFICVSVSIQLLNDFMEPSVFLCFFEVEPKVILQT